MHPPSLYLNCFERALNNYCNQKPRIGYTFTLFTKFRHSFKEYPALSQLKAHLEQSNEDQHKQLIVNFLKTNPLNDHSFGMYLLDELISDFPDEQWLDFHPKPIILFQGYLYRGSLQKYSDAFVNGMQCGSSDKIENYIKDANFGVGISTSTSLNVAREYQNTVYIAGTSGVVQKGYVYKVNYRGTQGIDITRTHLERGNCMSAFFASRKKEINIIGDIPAKDIMGCWNTKGEYYPNPNYVVEEALPLPKFTEVIKTLGAKSI